MTSGVKAKPIGVRARDLVPSRSDEHAGQFHLFALAVADRLIPVAEIQAAHRLSQPHRKFVTGNAYPKAGTAATDPARQGNANQGSVDDGHGHGDGQPQPPVDRRTDDAGLDADDAGLDDDAWRREQDLEGTVLRTVVVTQHLRSSGQFAAQKPAQQGVEAP
ncbi:hypothetical protein ACFYPA_29340 [Streptomyces sp. NPDC005775]|uniref:hypothetical protein n=1 Tax=Streptomyces sp. NPDC005775 TaxID=3364729 RepID=UPI00367C0BFD